jgi:hypothetical protein
MELPAAGLVCLKPSCILLYARRIGHLYSVLEVIIINVEFSESCLCITNSGDSQFRVRGVYIGLMTHRTCRHGSGFMSHHHQMADRAPLPVFQQVAAVTAWSESTE